MNSPRYARLAAKVLAKEHEEAARVPLTLVQTGTPATLAQRDEAIAQIEAAIVKSGRRRVVRRAMIAGAAIAAIAASAAGLFLRANAHVASAPTAAAAVAAIAHPSGDGAALMGAGAGAPMVDGQPLATGSRIVARPSGRALLAFATGTEVTLEDEGDLTIVDGGPAKTFALGAGALRAKVTKLGAGERFVVRTPDAEVEVRGTSFRVGVAPSDPACGDGTTTRVSVFEGTVVVRHRGAETPIESGSEWPRGCHAAHAAASAPKHVTAHAAPSSPAQSSPPSTLAEQNDLFADAVAAKRNGDARVAIARFDTFLTKYPSSALAESAAAQRMKLLRDVDARRASEAARAYLARWPNGFARADAEAIAAWSP